MEKNIEESLNNISRILEEDQTMAKDFAKELNNYFNEDEIKEILFAFKCANDYHRGQMRKSGEPYIIHPINVALILLKEMHLVDKEAIIAALLHDVIEDTDASKEVITALFGDNVANLVDGVSKMKGMNFASKTEKAQANDCKLLHTSVKDIRVIMLKIADRLHNMRTLIFKGTPEQIEAYRALDNPEVDIETLKIKPNYKQIEKSAETYALFVPLADRIGASLIRDELLKLSFMYLHNEDFRRYKAYAENFYVLNKCVLENNAIDISNILNKQNICHDINLKIKNYFEIYTDIRRSKSKQPYPYIYNLQGLINYEIVTQDEDKCEYVASLLRYFFKNDIVLEENYLSVPKTNGYQAIHLYINDGNNHIICYKICSEKMKKINDYGLGVLTEMYPNKTMADIQDNLNSNNAFVKAFKSVENLSSDNAEFLNTVRNELLSKQVEVISRDSKRYSLPRGASVLDFAYKIHSELGNEATSAIVNGRRVSLDYILSDGDNVLIISNTMQKYQPLENIQFCLTSKARKRIKESYNKTHNQVLARTLPRSNN